MITLTGLTKRWGRGAAAMLELIRAFVLRYATGDPIPDVEVSSIGLPKCCRTACPRGRSRVGIGPKGSET